MSRKRRGRGEGAIFYREDRQLWACTISLGYGGKGKRKRRTVYGKTKADVQGKLARLQSGSDVLVNPGTCTLQQFLERWLEDVVKPTRTPNTYRSYEGVVRCHVNEHIGGIRVANLQAVQVQGLYSEMERGGASARMRQLAHAVLHKAMAQAVKWGMLPGNPCSAVDRPRVARKEMKTLTPEQTHHLLVTARPHRLWALFVLAVGTGMRQGELFALRWEDIDLEDGTVFVQHTLEEIDGKFRLKEPKSAAGRRRIELPGFAVEALHEHRKRMLAEGHLAGPVFCDRRGGWLRKSNFTRQIYKPLLERAGLPDIRFHDLRHGHATLMLALGEHPKVVQERLGHSQITLTMDTYSHVLPSVQKKAAENLDQAFRKLG
jgi:integrase